MNVLLAEANVPYPQLKEMDDINPEFERADVALVDRRERRHEPGRPPARLAGVRACRSSTSTTPSRSSSSSARWAAATPASTTSSTLNPKTGMLFADAKEGLADLIAAVKAL